LNEIKPDTCYKGLSEWSIKLDIWKEKGHYLDLITICRDGKERRTVYSVFDMRPDAVYTIPAPSNPDSQFRFGIPISKLVFPINLFS
jgi:hypothetical protein